MDLSKLPHGFVKFVTWICQSCSRPLPNQSMLKFYQDFKACWSFRFELNVLTESRYLMPWVLCAFGNVSLSTPFYKYFPPRVWKPKGCGGRWNAKTRRALRPSTTLSRRITGKSVRIKRSRGTLVTWVGRRQNTCWETTPIQTVRESKHTVASSAADAASAYKYGKIFNSGPPYLLKVVLVNFFCFTRTSCVADKSLAITCITSLFRFLPR